MPEKCDDVEKNIPSLAIGAAMAKAAMERMVATMENFILEIVFR